jgi:DNA-binding beta-propeller fold protein YncE
VIKRYSYFYFDSQKILIFYYLLGTAGNASTLLNSPRGIVLDPNTNTFYVSDTNNNRVMSYTLNSTVGTLVAGGNGAGTSGNQLNNPRGLYFDPNTNSLFIANAGANNIVQWVIGASSWILIAGDINGAAGSGATTLNTPYDVTLDWMGNIYVADRYNYRIQFFLANQTTGTTIAGVSGTSGSSTTKFNEPLSVALDSQLNLYVADTDNDRVQKFVRY